MKRGKSVDFTGCWLAMETLGQQSSNDLSIFVKTQTRSVLEILRAIPNYARRLQSRANKLHSEARLLF
jgi:hypothetical protein